MVAWPLLAFLQLSARYIFCNSNHHDKIMGGDSCSDPTELTFPSPDSLRACLKSVFPPPGNIGKCTNTLKRRWMSRKEKTGGLRRSYSKEDAWKFLRMPSAVVAPRLPPFYTLHISSADLAPPFTSFIPWDFNSQSKTF